MRSLEETLSRWQATSECGLSVADLQRAVRNDGPSSPCRSGCRSVCWKHFLLSREVPRAELAQVLRHGRADYSRHHDRFLNFIRHPEALAQLGLDPLTDDPESPWNTARQDEIIRAEILQDVQRLPDEVNYHQSHMQTMILDILFVYCKVNPERGGYRQGMHELLAPIAHVVELDAVDRSVAGTYSSSLEESMLEVLDSSYIEHDAYIMFSRLMDHAHVFYQAQDASDPFMNSLPDPARQEKQSTIVERSRFIHEVCLCKVDDELACHLTNIEVLPQIFLIRWIRLLFSREFPLDQFLVLWDTIFAVDPSLDLIDLICCAMLMRIRWQLLEADYAACIQLLLKYPPPVPPHGPHTFVDDALYLRDHMDALGGSVLITKYTGKAPESVGSSPRPRSGTPSSPRSNSVRQRGLGGRSPLSSPSRFLQQQGGVESLFQGAAKSAKGVLERGEKLGLNHAVREAMGEIRRSMQSFNESRQLQRSPRNLVSEGAAAEALLAMERRNRQLAALLDESIASLRSVCMSSLDDKSKSLELIEVAAAKVQFVQVYLADPTMDMPSVDAAAAREADMAATTDAELDTAGDEEAIERVERPRPTETSPSHSGEVPSPGSASADRTSGPPDVAECDTAPRASQEPASEEKAQAGHSPEPLRPAAPIPTRSTLAQSSFSWMLEPDESASPTPPSASKFSTSQHKKRPSGNASRERNAFLFGEDTRDKNLEDACRRVDIFGLEPLQKPKNES
ncbi:hypothetical protein CDD83_9421 [Cordyceps sp. RAO-2017]|nr:hypothetical protein CDD83_9421 [Cordyceps sp. RAO-2017]